MQLHQGPHFRGWFRTNHHHLVAQVRIPTDSTEQAEQLLAAVRECSGIDDSTCVDQQLSLHFSLRYADNGEPVSLNTEEQRHNFTRIHSWPGYYTQEEWKKRGNESDSDEFSQAGVHFKPSVNGGEHSSELSFSFHSDRQHLAQPLSQGFDPLDLTKAWQPQAGSFPFQHFVKAECVELESGRPVLTLSCKIASTLSSCRHDLRPFMWRCSIKVATGGVATEWVSESVAFLYMSSPASVERSGAKALCMELCAQPMSRYN